MRMKSHFFSEENEEEEEHKGWSAMVAMCKLNLQPLLVQERLKESWKKGRETGRGGSVVEFWNYSPALF